MKLAILLIALLPDSLVDSNTVDAIEHNKVFHRNNQVLDQWIFWEWGEEFYRVVDWVPAREVKNGVSRYKGGFFLVFHNKYRGGMVVVRSHSFLETETIYDPEVEDRKRYPIETRRLLRDSYGRPYRR